jgi:hypothetical protein
MNNQVGAEKMRALGKMLSEEIPGLGYALFVFEFYRPGVANYVSNAQREDMIKTLEETLARFKAKQDFDTPEEN